MTNAVIFFLREVLEAMLIISLLLATANWLGLSRRWVVVAGGIGIVGAAIFASLFDVISEAADGVGQEIANGSILFLIYLALGYYGVFTVSGRRQGPRSPLPAWSGNAAIIAAIGLAITREGAEIFIYLSGYLAIPGNMQPILTGGAIGTGIGVSIGALIYYGISVAGRDRALLAGACLLIPVAAGMASQACNYLMQADVIPGQLPLWDSTAIVAEGSVLGELLYALFSYEATPTAIQVGVYVGAAVLILVAMLLMHYRAGRKRAEGVAYD